MTPKKIPLTKSAQSLVDAVAEGVAAYLVKHPTIRILVGALGAFVLMLGVMFTALWQVPIFTWLEGWQVAVPCLAAGFGALNAWQRSSRVAYVLSVHQEHNRSGSTDFRARIVSWPDRVVRAFVGFLGVLLIVFAAVTFGLQSITGLSWLNGVYVPSLSAGLAALGIWYVAGRQSNTRSKTGDALIDKLSKLDELRQSAVLNDAEYSEAKRRLLNNYGEPKE